MGGDSVPVKVCTTMYKKYVGTDVGIDPYSTHRAARHSP